MTRSGKSQGRKGTKEQSNMDGTEKMKKIMCRLKHSDR
jgi:hypothetical protein